MLNALIGKTISHYKILEKLGEGGMGVVYKAQDTKLDRLVALKFLPPSIAYDAEVRARFLNEAKAISSLNHPNVATIHDVEDAYDQKFIVLEYIGGGSLRKKIGPLMSISDVVSYATQIAEGLAHAHKRGIIHRDIKTDNIMLAEDGHVKVTDFGLARLGNVTHLTKVGSTLGTAAYMSPEQAQGAAVDHRSDIFSFGVVLYELSTSQLPFTGEHEAALLYEVVNMSPKPLEEVRADIPATLRHIIERTLEKDVGVRYQSLDEVLVDLKSLKRELETGEIGRVPTIRRRAWRKRLLLLVPAAAVLLAAFYFLPRLHFSPTSTAAEVPSLAILYLKNLGAEKDEPYCYGITQDLIIDLAKAGGIRVATMKDVLSVQEADLSIAKVAAKLGVRYVVEGSLKHEKDLFHLSAQVVEAATGITLWADRLQARAGEAASLQGRLATAIINALRLQPSASAALSLGRARTTNPEAYEYYLRAKYVYEKRKTKNETAVARGLLEKAVALDSAFVNAWIALGLSYEHAAEYVRAEKCYAHALGEAKASSDKAGEASALLGLGAVRHLTSENDGALGYYQQSLKLSQEFGDRNGTAWALNAIGIIYVYLGRHQEGLDHYTRSLAIFRELGDRKQESKLLNNVGTVYETLGDYSRALEYYAQRIAISQELNEPHPIAYGLSNSGNCYLALGEYSKAIDHFARALAIFKEVGDRMMESDVTGKMGALYFAVGDTAEAGENLSRSLAMAESVGDQERICDDASVLGALFEARGERGKALEQYTRGLRVGREASYAGGEARALETLGEYFFNSGEYHRAVDSLEKADSIYTERGEKQNVLRTTSLLALSEAGAGNRLRSEQLITQTEMLLDSVERNADFTVVYWRLSQAHKRYQNVAARSLYLEKAYKSMTEQAGRILDSPMRKSFLANVKANQEIIAARNNSDGESRN